MKYVAMTIKSRNLFLSIFTDSHNNYLSVLLSSVIILALLNQESVSAKGYSDPQAFLNEVKSSCVAKDPQRFLSLNYTAGMSQEDIQKIKDNFQKMVNSHPQLQPDKCLITPNTSGNSGAIVINGKKLEPTCEIKGKLDLVFANKDGSTDDFGYLYGIVNGVYSIVGFKTTELNWKGPPDVNLECVVTTNGGDPVKIHLSYNASGIDLESDSCDPSNGVSVMGQHFNEVKVTNSNPTEEISVVLKVDNEEIFKKSLKGVGVVSYPEIAAQSGQ